MPNITGSVVQGEGTVDANPAPLPTWKSPEAPVQLSHVGNCPKCGSPIYGRTVLMQGDPAPVQRSCHCTSSAETVRTT